MPVTQQQAALFTELRLSGASTFEAVEVLLAAEQANQAIELVSKAWVHERRGKGGQWTTSGGGLTGGMHHEQRAQRRAALKAARNPVTHEQVHEIAHQAAQTAAVHVGAAVGNRADKAAAERAHQSMMHVAQQLEEHEQNQNAVEKKKSRLKFGAMAASLISGAAGAYMENKYGLPGAAQAITSVSPALAEAWFEQRHQL